MYGPFSSGNWSITTLLLQRFTSNVTQHCYWFSWWIDANICIQNQFTWWAVPQFVGRLRRSSLYWLKISIYFYQSKRSMFRSNIKFAVTIKNFPHKTELAFSFIYKCWKNDMGDNQCKICTYIQLQVSYIHEYWTETWIHSFCHACNRVHSTAKTWCKYLWFKS